MFLKLLKRRAPVRAPASPQVPAGTVVWAVGDIHGRDDLLAPLVEAIRADLRTMDAQRKTVVFLGDYVDRGPGSRAVLKRLAGLPADEGVEWRFLKGNHEETMARFLEDPSVGAQWCEYGGDATLQSYGLRPPDMKHRAEAWRHLASDLNHKLGADERDFLARLEMRISVGDYFFAHAGARPGEPLESQADEDLLWIRGTFLRSQQEFEKVVVHGHTPAAEVHADRRRIGIDTRAYESGVLTALRLRGGERRILQAVSAAPVVSADGRCEASAHDVGLRWADVPAFADLPIEG
ncbi:metallophosphoesterase family protein [Brevundimonas sp.]|uniref:metallophosphoesterase family protein n=1 Tax=Brevundimonas sp. TaxID=1871086 RepID=UPI002D432DAB|nr:metallophosphoesterase family protein [Brevundimonas sp.]HYD28117.1 metallophosphoesterase family protein [Brevundimonas sp.]